MVKPVYPDTKTTSHQIHAPKRAAAIQKFDKTGIQAHFAQHQKIHIRNFNGRRLSTEGGCMPQRRYDSCILACGLGGVGGHIFQETYIFAGSLISYILMAPLCVAHSTL